MKEWAIVLLGSGFVLVIVAQVLRSIARGEPQETRRKPRAIASLFQLLGMIAMIAGMCMAIPGK